MRIATGCIGHETNTYSPVPTTIDSFRGGSFYLGDDVISAFQDTRTITGGYIAAAKENNLEIVPLLWTFATPSGTIAQDAYETLKAEFLERLENANSLDGVLLDLHGAMVTESIEDAEGDLIRSVREVVGELPIVTTLDLHANITSAMAQWSDVIIGFDTYPHVDSYERGIEAAKVMADIGRGSLKPTMAYRQLPLLTSPPAQCTMKPLMNGVLERLHALESGNSGVVTATLSMGFPFANIRDAGVSVLVTTNDDQALADREADRFASYIWEMREAFDLDLISIEDAIQVIRQANGKPFVLADGSDNPGGGGPCDGTVILRALIEADVQDAVVAVIADPESVKLAIDSGVGSMVDLEIGGKTDDLHGDSVEARCYVKVVSDGKFVAKGMMGRGTVGNMGRTCVVQCGGVEVVLTEKRIQPFDAQVLRSVGIEPKDRKVIALKSAVHYRADYEPIAHEIFEIDAPGVHSPILSNYGYHKLRRPIYPLDADAEWHCS